MIRTHLHPIFKTLIMPQKDCFRVQMSKSALLETVISPFYYPTKQTFAHFGEKVVGFLHYLLTDALKLPPIDIFSAENLSNSMCPKCVLF